MRRIRDGVRALARRLSAFFARWGGEEVTLTREPTFPGSPLVPRVRIQLDRLRTLRWTLWESAEFHRRTGHSVLKDGLNLLDIDESRLLELLAVAATHEDPGVRPEHLAPAIVGAKLTDVVAALMILITDSSPPMPEGGAENPLTAGALSHLMRRGSGHSPQRVSASATRSTGPAHRA